MAYTAVPTITTGDVATAAWGNTYIKDNFAAGVPDIFTADGEVAIGTGANAAESVAILDSSNRLKHEYGGLEFDANAITTNGAVGGASSGVMEIKTAVTQGEAQAGSGTRFSLWSPVRVNEAIVALESGGKVELIGTCEVSSGDDITITGLGSDHDTFIIAGSDINPTNDQQDCGIQFGDSGGIDDSAGEYAFHQANCSVTSASYSAGASTSASRMGLAAGGVGNATHEGIGFWLILSKPGNGTTNPTLHGTVCYSDGAGARMGGHMVGNRNAAMAVTQVRFKMDTGTIDTGRMTVYGMKHD